VANSVTLSGIVVTPVMEHTTKSGSKYLSIRIKSENIKGRIRETIYARINIYSENQIKFFVQKEVQEGDRVWVLGELMARKEDDSGKDVLEIRALQIDPIAN